MYKKITAFATALVISTGICSSCGLYSLAFDLTTKESSAISNDDAVSTSDEMYVENKPYSDYYNIYSGKTRPNTEILVDGADYSSVAGGDFSVGSMEAITISVMDYLSRTIRNAASLTILMLQRKEHIA